MKTPSEQVLERIDRLIAKGLRTLATHTPNSPNVIGFATLDTNAFAEWRSQGIHMLQSVVGSMSIYRTDFEEQVKQGYGSSVQAGIGILKALREDVENGHLAGLVNLVRAEVFSDFLEMASHLLAAGYKDPAASLTGAVLENGLRKIASSHGIPVAAKDDLSALSQKLAQGSVYSQLVRQQIQVWTTVRNKADHGQFDEYTMDDVKAMIAGVTGFLSSNLG